MHFLSDGLKRRFIRNPEPGSTPTIFKGPKEECDDGDYIPQFTKKGNLVIDTILMYTKAQVLSKFKKFCKCGLEQPLIFEHLSGGGSEPHQQKCLTFAKIPCAYQMMIIKKIIVLFLNYMPLKL